MRRILLLAVLPLLAAVACVPASVRSGDGDNRGQEIRPTVAGPAAPAVTFRRTPQCEAYYVYQLGQLAPLVPEEARGEATAAVRSTSDALKAQLPEHADQVEAVTVVNIDRIEGRESTPEDLAAASAASDALGKWYIDTCSDTTTTVDAAASSTASSLTP